MFYEIREDEIRTKKLYKHLINLDKILEVTDYNFCQKSDYQPEFWKFTVHFTDKESRTFYYCYERDCKVAWESLKEAIRQVIGIFNSVPLAATPLSEADSSSDTLETYPDIFDQILGKPSAINPDQLEIRFK